MKKTIITALVTALLVTLIGSGFIVTADSLPSSKAAANVKDITIIDWTDEEAWTKILEQSIKTPNQKDLFIDVSLETGLYTETLVKSKRTSAEDEDWDTSMAKAEIQVRVVIDEGTPGVRYASPESVVFNSREQTLSAKFMGIFTGDCLIVEEVPIDNDEDGLFNEDPEDGIDNDGDGYIDEDPIDFEHVVTIDYECLEPEELELILETLSANSFNFVIDQLSPGIHTVSVQACIVTNGSAEEGKFEAKALVGRGSVVIEVVRMIQGAEWLELD